MIRYCETKTSTSHNTLDDMINETIQQEQAKGHRVDVAMLNSLLIEESPNRRPLYLHRAFITVSERS